VRAMAAIGDGAGIDLAPWPDEGWAAVLLGEGFDPVDGASRLAILRRASESVFASVRVQGRVAAVGSACFSHGWCGIHGMRTAPAYRGRGLASSILAALAAEAQRRGIARAFLQVEEGNPAQALYARAGFATAWVYAYWQRHASAAPPSR
jgi:ribosomal protein S18 acetylase RimI-like enzyme